MRSVLNGTKFRRFVVGHAVRQPCLYSPVDQRDACYVAHDYCINACPKYVSVFPSAIRYPEDRHPSPVEVIRNLGGQWPDRELAVTMNRMRCRSAEGTTWTAVRVRELRERMRIAPFDPTQHREATISVDETARRLEICVGSVLRLIREGILPAKQLMPSAPWQVQVAALDTEAVKIGVRAVIERRPRNFEVLQNERTLKLPGFQ